MEGRRERFGQREKDKRRRAEEGNPTCPMEGGGAMAGIAVCPVPGNETPIATPIRRRPLHSRPTRNEMWNVNFAPDYGANLRGNHHVSLLSTCKHTVHPRSCSHWRVAPVKCRPRKSVIVAKFSVRSDRISKPNSSCNERLGSIREPHLTDRNTHGLRAGGAIRLYFDGSTLLLSLTSGSCKMQAPQISDSS
jgi:hypothetical protein